jgi:pimeloyl-ACP methyl ester carboxylesterase
MKIIRVRGIGEPMKGNMLSGVTSRIPDAEVVELPYSAAYGFVPDPKGAAYAVTLVTGTDLLRRELDKGPAVVLGYSAGAHIAGNVAAGGHKNLIGVGLIADPAMPGRGKYGIVGSRPVPNVPVKWIANPGDIICQCPDPSPLRTIPALTREVSVNPDRAKLNAAVLAELTSGRLAAALRFWRGNPIATDAYWRTAIEGARGYRDGTQHQRAYVGARQAELAGWVRSL